MVAAAVEVTEACTGRTQCRDDGVGLEIHTEHCGIALAVHRAR